MPRRGNGRKHGRSAARAWLEQEVADRQDGKPAATVAGGRREREGGRRTVAVGCGLENLKKRKERETGR